MAGSVVMNPISIGKNSHTMTSFQYSEQEIFWARRSGWPAEHLQLNCCMQAGVQAWATTGFSNLPTGTGGENLSGGLTAKGIPKNLFTVTVAEGKEVVVPITSPTSIVAVGLLEAAGACGWPSEIWVIGAAPVVAWGWPSLI